MMQMKIDHESHQCSWLTSTDRQYSQSVLTYEDIRAQVYDDSYQSITIAGVPYEYETHPITPSIDLITLVEPRQTGAPAQEVNLDIFNLANTLLAACPTEHDVCLQGVKFMKDMIGVDRAGVLLMSEDREHVVGTWGTDEQGNITDESDMRIPLQDNHWMLDAIQRPEQLIVKNNVALTSYSKVVGTGWNAIISIYQDKQPLGWLCCDNLLSAKPLTEGLRAQIRLIGSILGQWMIRIRNESELRRLNETLEAEVIRKTQDLNATIVTLKEMQKELVHTERTKALSIFTAGVAHEVNNPIGFIRSNLSFIGKVSSKVLETLRPLNQDALEKPIFLLGGIDQVIDESVDGLDRVTNIIRMLQPLNKLADEQAQPFNLMHAISQAIEDLPEHSFEIDVQENLEKTEVVLPMQIVVLVLKNVLENALKAVRNQEEPKVVLEVREDDREITIRVQDNGHGIEEEKLQDIFLPFFTTRSPGDGFGLGLALSQNLLQLAGGDISVSSTVGLGSTFSIHLYKD